MKRKIIFAFEILILLIFIGGLYIYGQVNKKLEKIEQPEIVEEEIAINPEVKESGLTGYTTYALFGIDHRTKNEELSGENSDTMIIASINNDTGEVKLVSVFRDTVLNVGGDRYSKANSAYASGGPEKAISMLNTNLDLNITDYATVDFSALATVVDLLGGMDLPLSYAEIVHMNDYCVETAEETGKSYTPVELPPEKPDTPEGLEKIVGTYHLNGVQVTSYCRIRYTASLDMGRTARQRNVIAMLVEMARRSGLTTIFRIMDEVFPMVQTSLKQTEILKMIPLVIGYRLKETTGFPIDYRFADMHLGEQKVSIIAANSLVDNVVELHKFLYGEDVPYTPSSFVTSTSARIDEILASGGQELSITETPEEELYEDEDTYDYGTDYEDNGYDDGSGYGDGDYDDGSGYGDGGYDDGSGYGDGGYDDGSGYGDGGYDDGSSGGGYDDGNGGGYDDGNGGGYDDGSGGGGYDDGSGDGGYGDGSGGDSGYEDGGGSTYESGYGGEDSFESGYTEETETFETEESY